MKRFALVAVLAMASSVFAAGYDAAGFEGFALGALNGQDGWVGASAGGGVEPVVVDVGPVIGTKAVKLEVPNVQGAASTMEHAFVPADLIAAGYNKLTVSYDIYRPADGTDQNLWWWLWDAGEPTYGLQWDIGGTAPHGWNAGAGSAPTVFGRYATIVMEWDLAAAKAYSWYDGVLVDNGIPISNLNMLTGWSIVLSYDAAPTGSADYAYIDNFLAVAVPEPAAFALLALGALLRRR